MSAGMAKGFATVTATMQAQSQAVVSALKNIQSYKHNQHRLALIS